MMTLSVGNSSLQVLVAPKNGIPSISFVSPISINEDSARALGTRIAEIKKKICPDENMTIFLDSLIRGDLANKLKTQTLDRQAIVLQADLALNLESDPSALTQLTEKFLVQVISDISKNLSLLERFVDGLVTVAGKDSKDTIMKHLGIYGQLGSKPLIYTVAPLIRSDVKWIKQQAPESRELELRTRISLGDREFFSFRRDEKSNDWAICRKYSTVDGKNHASYSSIPANTALAKLIQGAWDRTKVTTA